MNLQHIILQGVKELLFTHDYLVLPEFGGFVLKSRASHISRNGGLILPPSKTVSFNVQLKQNDGLLVLWLQNSISCTASEALKHLKEFTDYCSGVLSAKRRLNMDGLGFFFIDFENNICFEPQHDVNFLSDSFGLGSVSIQPIENEVPEIKKEMIFVDRQISREETIATAPLKTRRFKHIITPLIVATLSLSLLLLIVSNMHTKGLMYASVMGTKTSGVYSPLNYSDLNLKNKVQTSSSYVADANGVASLKISEKKIISVLALENKVYTGSLNSTTLKSKHTKYEIVLGCFTVLSNAKRMHKVLQAKKLQTTISTKNSNGMYVVSDCGFETKEEAINRLEELKSNYPKAWIKTSE